MKEITIAGGGLAGLSLGIALRRKGLPVTLHEAGSYPRHRVCGEFINGVNDTSLDRLGILDCFHDARRHSSTRWFVRDRPIYDAALPEPAIGISRHRLDQRLARAFESAGGTLHTRSRLAPAAADGLVWAAGRKSHRESPWIGLKLHFERLPMETDLEIHIGRSGYLGLTPIEGDRVNACGLFRRRSATGRKSVEILWDYLEANGLHRITARLREAPHDEGSFTGVSAFHLGRQRSADRLCVLGDAESMIAPFTGNGMSMAFESAEIAVAPLTAYSSGNTSWEQTCALLREGLHARFRTRLFTARCLHPILLTAPGRQALSLTERSGLLPFSPLFRLLR